MRAKRRARCSPVRWGEQQGLYDAAVEQPAPVLQVCRHHATAEKDDTVFVELFVRARRAEPLEIVRRGVGVEMREKSLRWIRSGCRGGPDSDVGFALARSSSSSVVMSVM